MAKRRERRNVIRLYENDIETTHKLLPWAFISGAGVSGIYPYSPCAAWNHPLILRCSVLPIICSPTTASSAEWKLLPGWTSKKINWFQLGKILFEGIASGPRRIRLVDLGIAEDFLNRAKSTTKQILEELFETGTSGGGVEIDTRRKSISMNVWVAKDRVRLARSQDDDQHGFDI